MCDYTLEIYEHDPATMCPGELLPGFPLDVTKVTDTGVDTTDEDCAFEILASSSLVAAAGGGTGSTQTPDDTDPRTLVRNVLKADNGRPVSPIWKAIPKASCAPTAS